MVEREIPVIFQIKIRAIKSQCGIEYLLVFKLKAVVKTVAESLSFSQFR